MKDLNSLVNEQEEVLDTVEVHVESAAASAERGVRDVEVANAYLTCARWKYLIAFVLLLVLIAVIVLAVYFQNPQALAAQLRN
jgi:t-SNARE complex subunit (syntaxin)